MAVKATDQWSAFPNLANFETNPPNDFLDRGPLSLPRVRRNIGSDPDNMNRNDSGFLGIIYSSGTTSLQDMARRFTDTMNNIGRFISDANSNGNNQLVFLT